jgi:hypothetical protein
MQNIDKNIVSEVLQMFTGDRWWYQNIFTIKDKCYATNGNCIISINKNFAPEYPELIEYSQNDFLKVFEKEDNFNYFIDISDLENLIINFPKVDKSTNNNCSACDGNGLVEWEFYYNNQTYNKEYDCPVCDGVGENSEKNVIIKGGNHYNAKCTVKILEFCFKFEYIYNLYLIANHFKINNINITYQKNLTKFKIGNFELYLSHINMKFYDDFKELKVNK